MANSRTTLGIYTNSMGRPEPDAAEISRSIVKRDQELNLKFLKKKSAELARALARKKRANAS